MPKATLGDMLRSLRHMCETHGALDLTDGQLLQRFLAQRDEAAFTILVQRHGPMVLGVCRRVLGDAHGAEDSCQATFMVLVRRAASISCTGSLTSWLYTVAQRIATKARAQTAARHRRERRWQGMPRTDRLDDLTWQELRSVLDEEIARLPERYRAPIVNCYFEGKSYDQAAQDLGWPKSSLASRLCRARELLRQQLTRRGIALTAGMLAAALGEKAAGAPLTALLTINTVKAAIQLAAGKTLVGGLISVRAAALVEEAMKPMIGIKGKLVLALVALGLAIGGAGLAAHGALAGKSSPDNAPELPATAAKSVAGGDPAKKDATVATDLHGDPLPDGAVARLGTVRLRHGVFTSKVAFALGGRVLASAGGDLFGSWVCLWDAATGKLLHRLPETPSFRSLAVSADGKWLVTADLRLLDVATAKEQRRFKAPAGFGPASVAFSPDGQTVAAGEFDGKTRVMLWDVNTAKELVQLKGHTGPVASVAFSVDSKVVASGSSDKTVRLWDAATGKQLHCLEGHEKPVTSIAFSPGGKVLASAGEDRVIRLWHAETGKLLHKLSGDGQLAFAPPDGKLLASAGSDGQIRLWDTDTGKEVRRWVAFRWGPRGLTTVAFSPDGKVLASAGMHDHAIRLWDARAGKELQPFAAHTGGVVSLHFAAGGKTLFSSGQDNNVLEWDVTSSRERSRLFGGDRSGLLPEGWSWHAHNLSADGKILALMGSAPVNQDPLTRLMDPAIRLLDTATGKETSALKNTEWLRSLRCSPDGKLVAADGKDGIRVWDTPTGKELLLIKGHRPHSSTLIFSPDGALLAWGGDADRTVRLWDIATGKELRSWPTQQEKTRVLVFSPDGQFIAGADRQDVRIWSVATGKELMRFRGQSGQSWITALAFSPSGRILAAGGERTPKKGAVDSSCVLYLWETVSGQEIRQIASPQGGVSALAFAPGGRILASGGADSTILLWDLTGRSSTGKLKPMALSAAELDGLWSDLAGDAAKADRALWALALAPKQSLPLLKDRLRPVAAADAQKVAALVADLDDKNFAVRDKATRTLEEMGEAAEAALRKTLQGNPSLEVRQRLEQILQKRGKDVIRQLRAIEALEQTGTADAQQILEGLAKAIPNPQAAHAAALAAQRLAK
jgi:RNA polymerase sigma factor (sigma-70 family)